MTFNMLVARDFKIWNKYARLPEKLKFQNISNSLITIIYYLLTIIFLSVVSDIATPSTTPPLYWPLHPHLWTLHHTCGLH